MANDVTLVTFTFEQFDYTNVDNSVLLHVFLIRQCHLEQKDCKYE